MQDKAWVLLALSALLLALPTMEIAPPENQAPPPLQGAPEKAKPRVTVQVAPQIKNDREARAWKLVERYANRFGIGEKAHVMFWVIRCESSCRPDAVSPSGQYLGMCQFTTGTFQWAVSQMKRAGHIAAAREFSPFDPEHSVQVMAWMWSKGYQTHWGPLKRYLRRIARQPAKALLAPAP